MSNRNYRLPAEWEKHACVLLSWPHAKTDWAYILDEVTECYVRVAEAIICEARLVIVAPDTSVPASCLLHLPQDRITYISMPTNDTWARDFGPITVVEGDGMHRCLHFRFNGWGLKFAANHDNLIALRLAEIKALGGDYVNCQDFVLEGGSIESDGQGTIMTTSNCLLSPNRNSHLSRNDIEKRLREYFNVDRVLWVDHGCLVGDDTDSHIDTLARLAPDNTIVYVGAPYDVNDEHYVELKNMEQQLKGFRSHDNCVYRLIKLPFPAPVYFDGERLPATYANYLVIGNSVLVPQYSQPENDEAALNAISLAFPQYNVKGVDCSALIKQHGSLHCITMQLNPL